MAKGKTTTKTQSGAEGSESNTESTEGAATTETGKLMIFKSAMPHAETRKLTPKDFKDLNPDSQIDKVVEWTPENHHRVDVSEWSQADIDGVLTEPGFKLHEPKTD